MAQTLIHARPTKGSTYTMCGWPIGRQRKLPGGKLAGPEPLRCTALATRITCPDCKRIVGVR